MKDCTIKIHANDIELVRKYFYKKYKKLYLAGHSLGGTSVLLAVPKANAIILWDPSPPKFLKVFSPYCKYNKSLDAFVIDSGIQTIMSKNMYNEMKQSKIWLQWIKKTKIPVKIIGASDNIRVSGCKAYFKYANDPKKLVFIKGAGHTFSEEGAEEKLFKETLDWINKY